MNSLTSAASVRSSVRIGSTAREKPSGKISCLALLESCLQRALPSMPVAPVIAILGMEGKLEDPGLGEQACCLVSAVIFDVRLSRSAEPSAATIHTLAGVLTDVGFGILH